MKNIDLIKSDSNIINVINSNNILKEIYNSIVLTGGKVNRKLKSYMR